MEKRLEHRKKSEVLLDVIFKKQKYTVKTTNVSTKGFAIEASRRLCPSNGELLHFVTESHQRKVFFSGMVKWYRSQLSQNLMGLQIVNPPAEWAHPPENSDRFSDLIFQLHFGDLSCLKEEYQMHLTHGFLEVSPTPQVPSLNAPVIVDVFLLG